MILEILAFAAGAALVYGYINRATVVPQLKALKDKLLGKKTDDTTGQ